MSLNSLSKERDRVFSYVTALISCYSSRDEYSRLFDESKELFNFLKNYSEFDAYLTSPMYAQEQKEKFMRELIRVFAFHQTYFSSTLLLLLQRHLIEHLSFFLESLIFRLERLLNQRIIKVYSSQRLTIKRKAQLKKSLEEKFRGEEIVFDYIVAPEMIAGIKVEYDDAILECSVAKKLEVIKEELLKL